MLRAFTTYILLLLLPSNFSTLTRSISPPHPPPPHCPVPCLFLLECRFSFLASNNTPPRHLLFSSFLPVALRFAAFTPANHTIINAVVSPIQSLTIATDYRHQNKTSIRLSSHVCYLLTRVFPGLVMTVGYCWIWLGKKIVFATGQ
jgi:hypothetical protein